MSILETNQLTKYFGDTHAVDHIDFTVTEGEVLLRDPLSHAIENVGEVDETS